jgi:ASC-1-like (ASCH) protein
MFQINKFRKHLSEPWFSHMAIGNKTIEGRLNKGDWNEIKEGDEIYLVNEDFELKRELVVSIISKKIYPSFESYLKTEGLSNTLPLIDKIEDGVKIYNRFYKPEEEIKYGVVSLELKVLKIIN